jgi:hypothetical protein
VNDPKASQMAKERELWFAEDHQDENGAELVMGKFQVKTLGKSTTKAAASRYINGGEHNFFCRQRYDPKTFKFEDYTE